MPERDEAYINKVRIHLATTVWGPAHSNWQRWLDFYECQHPMRTAQSAQERRLPLAASKIQTLTDTLITNEPRCHREPLSESEKDKALADKVEKWSRGFLKKGARVWGLIPPFRTGGHHMGVYGYTVEGAKWDDSYWKGEPKQGVSRYEEKMEAWKAARKFVFPFQISAPHPARVLLPPNERIPSMAVEQFTLYAYQAAKEYSGVERLREVADAAPFKLLQGIVYWEEDWLSVVLDNEKVMSKPNLYGFVPWTHSFAGRGLEHMRAGWAGDTVTGSFGPAPEDLAKGYLARNEDVITAVDELVAAGVHMGLVDVYRTTMTTKDPEVINTALARLGAVVGPVAKDDITWAQPLQVQPWVFDVLRLLMSSLDVGTFMGVVQGQRSPGVDTATQHAMQLAQARLGFVMPMDQLNFMAGQICGMAMKMVTVNDEPITIDGITCSPRDFQGNYDIQVDFMAEDENALARERTIGSTEVEKGMRSLETHLKRIGEEDTTGELRRIDVERMAKAPQVDAAIIEAVEARFRAEKGLPPPMPQSTTGPGPGPGRPQSFVAQPGGPEEQAALLEGMTQIPGNGMERAGA